MATIERMVWRVQCMAGLYSNVEVTPYIGVA